VNPVILSKAQIEIVQTGRGTKPLNAIGFQPAKEEQTVAETPPAPIEIHPIEPDEIDAAVELIRPTLGDYDAYDFDSDTGDLTPAKMDDLYEEPKGRFWVAKSGDTLVGTVAMRRVDDRTARVTRLSVHADYRRHDVVQQLMPVVETYAREAGYRRLIAEATTRQKPAATFLESIGFQEYKRSLRQKIIIIAFEKSI
jgi:N-acetylglutamate synthase-like GNAT family acetyltransferase